MSWLNPLVSVIGLLAAIALLIGVLRLRRVALGGAISDNLPTMVLGIVSFAGGALLWWVSNFVDRGVATAQALLGAQVMNVMGMAFFAWYFMRMHQALRGYVSNAERVLAHLDSSKVERG